MAPHVLACMRRDAMMLARQTQTIAGPAMFLMFFWPATTEAFDLWPIIRYI